MSATHLHAMFIHFPIALLIVGFASEVTGLLTKREFYRKTAFLLLVSGALGTVVSYFSGNLAGSGIEEGPLKKALDMHEQAGVISLWLTVTAVFVYLAFYLFKYKKVWIRTLGVILFAAVVGTIARTGYLGGQLVYKHGAGVQLELPDFSNSDKSGPGN